MIDFPRAVSDRDLQLDNLAAELSAAAYEVALRHGMAGTWLDLELDLWRAMADTLQLSGLSVHEARASQSEGSPRATAILWTGNSAMLPRPNASQLPYTT